MTNNIRRLISIIWLWNLCVGDIVEENLIRYESTSDIEGLAVTTRECGNDDPTNKAVLRLEIDCDENISSIRNDVNALRESMKKEFYAIKQSLQTCSSDIISDISKLLSKDECAGTNNCSANADCIDGVLSYRCNCRPGYEGDGFTCSDIDECCTDNHKCHSRANCTNTIGSYTCRCRPPYSGNGYICNEECAGTNNCSANADCIDGVQSYRCNCRPGYQGDGFTCSDIDECSTGNHTCHSQANCTNTIGSYTCRCMPPYYGNGYTCNEECAGTNNCSANADCIDGVQSYRCNCRPGYQGDGFTCSDIDECSTGNHTCHSQANCSNTIGSYTCRCMPPYSGNGYTCNDIDECSTDNHKCHSRANCINTIGSYTCRCRPPYSGNGYTCNDIACGSPAKLIKGLGCVIPVREIIEWTKARDHCHRLGYRLLEGITNTDQLNQLREHFDQGVFSYPRPNYHDVWLGIKDNRWVEGPNTQVPPDMWYEGQPDQSDSCGYVALQMSPPTLWDNKCLTHSLPFFCQAMLE